MENPAEILQPVPSIVSTRRKKERPLKKFPQILVAVLLLFYGIFFVWRAYACLTYPYPVEYGEGAVFYEASHLTSGETLYTANTQPPYRAVIYGPFYYYLDALFSDGNSPSLFWGRFLSVVSSLIVGWCIYIVARQKLNIWFALGAIVTPFATGPIFEWATISKPDMLAIALSIGAVTLLSQTLVKNNLTKNYWPVYLAAVLCVVALFIKQSSLAAPAAILIFLCVFSWRAALRFAGVGIVLSAAIFVFFQATTQGIFFTHFISYNSQPYSLLWLQQGSTYLIETFPILLLFGAIWVVRSFRAGWRSPGLWEWYWLAAFLVSFSVGKVGANFNYYIELILVSSLLTWQLAGEWWQNRPALSLKKLKLSLSPIAFWLLALQMLLLHHIPVISDTQNTPSPTLTAQSEQIVTAIKQYAANGPMIVEDAGWLPPLNINTDLDDSFVFGQVADGGQWNQKDFLQALSTGHYKTVMLTMAYVDNLTESQIDQVVAEGNYYPVTGRFSPEMLQVFQQHFKPAKRIGKTVFLIWNG